MATIAAADPASKVAYIFDDPVKLVTAIQDYGYIPLHADGTPMKAYSFEGGILLDGAPLNVWFNGGWYSGQQEILQPFWKSGDIMVPPSELLAYPVVGAPSDVIAQYASYKGVQDAPDLLTAYQQGGTFGGNTWMWIGGGLVLAWLLFR